MEGFMKYMEGHVAGKWGEWGSYSVMIGASWRDGQAGGDWGHSYRVHPERRHDCQRSVGQLGTSIKRP